MFSREIASSWSNLGWAAFSAVAMLGIIIAVVRVAGLRSFSKMSSFDFAVTVAFGSLLASVAMSRTSLLDGAVAAAALMAAQCAIAWGRSRWRLTTVVDNRPLLLMAGSEVLHDHLRRARVTEDDLRAKLREANVTDYRQIKAVVLETTGDIAVLHGDPDEPFDPDLLADVEGMDQVRSNAT